MSREVVSLLGLDLKATLPNGRRATLVWIRHMFDNLYEVSLRLDNLPGYQTWYAYVTNGEYEWVECVFYESPLVLAIGEMDREINGGES